MVILSQRLPLSTCRLSEILGNHKLFGPDQMENRQLHSTHQLRVHLKQLNHPIVGDDLYDGSEAGRLYLHALSLELTLPNRKREKFTAKLPLEFSKMVK